MKKFVISGINLFQAGPLSIYYDCLNNLLKSSKINQYKITAFVNKKELFEEYKDKIELIELPKSRKSYLYRLYYEYFYFYKYSKNKDIDVWISLHDITPRVISKRLYTYCHNPTPFMKKDLSKIKYSFKVVAFSFFYKFIYRINIKTNTAVIVQQDWMRTEFKKMFLIKNVIVARPNINVDYKFEDNKNKSNKKKSFIYVAYPRFFKNFEVIFKAIDQINRDDFEILVTLDGTENKYSKDLYKKYCNNKNIKWLGLKSRKEIFDLYNEADYMIFPSILETWGLPINEFKLTGKPIILADLPYSHETLGSYDKVKFFNPYNYKELKEIIIDICNNNLLFKKAEEIIPSNPYASNWIELFKLIL